MKDLFEAAQSGSTVLTSEPRCDISLYRVSYNTQGAAGEPTDANTVVAVPSGADARCSGDRPVLLYAPGSSVQQSFDMAELRGNAAARMVAAMFAGQGFVLVAPNYAGYAGSALPYHVYLDAAQQSSDMVDALRAARAPFGMIGALDSGLDLDRSPKYSDPYRDQKLGFKAAKAAVRYAASQRAESPDAAVAATYHAGLVAPFCMRSARQFFRNVMR